MVTAASLTETGPMLTIGRSQAAALIKMLGIPRNTLNAIFALPEAPRAAAGWEAFASRERAALQLALPLLAAPAIVARTRILFGESMLATWALTGSGNEPAAIPYLLLAHDEKKDDLQMRLAANREVVARSLMPYLDAGMPATPGDGFELPVGAFGLFIACCDLVQRARFSAALDHTPIQRRFTLQDLELALADGRQQGDPRWLLPQLLAIRPDLPENTAVAQGLEPLIRQGWVTEEGDAIRLGQPGMQLAQSMAQRLGMLSFWVAGASAQGELASRSALFVRTPWRIWCFDVGGEDGRTVIGAPVSAAAAYGLIQDLLTPVGTPPLVTGLQPPPAVDATFVPGGSLDQTITARQELPWRLAAQAGALAGQEFLLAESVSLGRGEDNSIRLQDQMASRHHARIVRENGRYFIEDLGSSNGTLVNGTRIAQKTALQAGDRVTIGETVLVMVNPQPPLSATAVCPHCGQRVPPTAGFCRYCGGALN